MMKKVRHPRTRILATLGPASSSRAVLRGMYDAGLDAVRLNFSHGTNEEADARVNLVRDLNRKLRRRVTILQDLKGNRIRIGRLKAPVPLKKGQTLTLVQGGRHSGTEIPFDYRGSLKVIKKGCMVYIDDGNIALEVRSVGRDSLSCTVTAAALLKERKGVNIPLARLDFPLLSAEDRADIDFGVSRRVDMIALSFVRSAGEMAAFRELVKPRLPGCLLVAKIEAREAIDNLDGILEYSDAVMVARGDMGVMFPLWQIPLLQKRIIRRCNEAGKPVITATQMLESMTAAPLPTRAEVSDVANAVLDGTDYAMLSAETAAGKYPVQAVRVMNEIIRETESAPEFRACGAGKKRA